MKLRGKVRTGHLKEERRDFLKSTGTAAVMALFGVGFFTGCTDDEDMDPQMPDEEGENDGIVLGTNEVTIKLDQNEGLAEPGGWLLITAAKLLVVNTGQEYQALTSVCTHSQCDRNWSFSNDVFTCSCHGSRFTTEGAVVQGPATQPLKTYNTTLENQLLKINLS
ncbi:MAG: Rieske (2Fe-2S) protein [Cyclobacteriaceae bacterium]